MRFLIDANLPRSIIAALQRFGHDVEFARDIGLGAAPDEQIAAYALKNTAAILSRDLDFADIRRYPPEKYHGIVVLRLPDAAVAHSGDRQRGGTVHAGTGVHSGACATPGDCRRGPGAVSSATGGYELVLSQEWPASGLDRGASKRSVTDNCCGS